MKIRSPSGRIAGVSGQRTASFAAISDIVRVRIIPDNAVAGDVRNIEVAPCIGHRPSVLPPTVPRFWICPAICASVEPCCFRTAVGSAYACVPVVTVQYKVSASGESAMPLMPISSGLPGHTSAPWRRLYAGFNLQGRVAIQYASGCTGVEIHNDQTNTVFRRTSRSAVGNVCDTTILIDNDIIEEARLTVSHAVRGSA